jgi:hypothetical protein
VESRPGSREAGSVDASQSAGGTVVRQELAWTDAEDVIEIVDRKGSARVPAAACTKTCLVTHDFSALEPGVTESKYYQPGIGLILELGPDGERLELTKQFTP